jgi:hypothetical protein
VFVHLTGKIIYAGQSVDTTRRWKQHAAKQDSGIQSFLKRNNMTFDKLRIKVVDELPDGCARRDANRMEAYFIAKHNLVYNAVHNADVANNTNGNYAREIDVEAMTAELENGYEWPKECEAEVQRLKKVTPELKAATAVVEILETIQIENPEIEEDVETALVEAKETKSKVEDGPYGYAKEAYEEYKAMPPYKKISRAHLSCHLNAIQELDSTNKALKQKWHEWQLLFHPDKDKTPIGVGEAMHIMGLVAEWLGNSAEEGIDTTTTTAKWCLKLRAWVEANNGKKPTAMAKKSKTALDNPEAASIEMSFGVWMNHWKNNYGKPDQPTAKILLRHHPNLLTFLFDHNRSETTQAKAQEANKLLREGYGISIERTERDDPSLKPWIVTTAGNAMYNFMHHLLQGEQSDAIVNVVLQGLPQERAEWLRAEHDKHVESYREKRRLAAKAQTKRSKAVNQAIKDQKK